MNKRVNTCLIDGGLVLYSCAYAAKNCTTQEQAQRYVDRLLYDIFTACNASHYQGFMDSKENFRREKAVTAAYKAGRKKEKPQWFYPINDYLLNTWGFLSVRGFEADDLIATQATKLGLEAIICSYDKDLKQIPGRYYNWYKRECGAVNSRQAQYHLALQMLTGDPVDNIQGLPKIGPKKAEKLLTGASVPMTAAFEAYIKTLGLSKGIYRFTENYTLLSLVTDVEVTEEPREVPVSKNCCEAAQIPI